MFTARILAHQNFTAVTIKTSVAVFVCHVTWGAEITKIEMYSRDAKGFETFRGYAEGAEFDGLKAAFAETVRAA